MPFITIGAVSIRDPARVQSILVVPPDPPMPVYFGDEQPKAWTVCVRINNVREIAGIFANSADAEALLATAAEKLGFLCMIPCCALRATDVVCIELSISTLPDVSGRVMVIKTLFSKEYFTLPDDNELAQALFDKPIKLLGFTKLTPTYAIHADQVVEVFPRQSRASWHVVVRFKMGDAAMSMTFDSADSFAEAADAAARLVAIIDGAGVGK